MKFYKEGLSLRNHINRIIEEALIQNNYHRQATAEALNMSVRTLRDKLATNPKVKTKYSNLAASRAAEAHRASWKKAI